MAVQPTDGDAVVAPDPDESASWVVSAFPGPAQLRYPSANAAIDAATRYAAHVGVQVWLAGPWRLHVPDALRPSATRDRPVQGDRLRRGAARAAIWRETADGPAAQREAAPRSPGP